MSRPARPGRVLAGEPVEVFGGDETFIAVAPDRLAPLMVAGHAAGGVGQRSCWPDLEFRVTRDRGAKGCQWAVSGAAGGTAEVWLEPCHDGTIVHLYLRLRVLADRRGRIRPPVAVRELAWRRWITGIKDRLDAGRGVGEPVASPTGTPDTPGQRGAGPRGAGPRGERRP